MAEECRCPGGREGIGVCLRNNSDSLQLHPAHEVYSLASLGVNALVRHMPGEIQQ